MGNRQQFLVASKRIESNNDVTIGVHNHPVIDTAKYKDDLSVTMTDVVRHRQGAVHSSVTSVARPTRGITALFGNTARYTHPPGTILLIAAILKGVIVPFFDRNTTGNPHTPVQQQ
jgi:hypothetical protein